MPKRGAAPEPIAANNSAFLCRLSSNLLTGYPFYFSGLYFDEYIRLGYAVSPHVKGLLSIYAEAQDDLGNHYDFRGGAYGLWRFAPCT